MSNNNTETEIEGGWCGRYFSTDMYGENAGKLDRKDPVLLVVSGPDQEEEICLLATPETYLPRHTAEALMKDLAQRLGFKVVQGLT